MDEGVGKHRGASVAVTLIEEASDVDRGLIEGD
jgi:hypothetical protein